MKWKKLILRTVAALLALAICVVLLALFLVNHSPSVRRTILGKVERYAEELTGTQVSIRDFNFDLSALNVRLEGIVARGRPTQSTPPMLQIENLDADIKVDSILRGQWHLQSLTIHHPIVHISQDNPGTEKPRSQNDANAGIAKIFDLAVQKCLIEGGEVYFSDTKSQLEAELNDLQFRAGLDHAADRYNGALSYSHGKIAYANYAPVVHDLDTRFVLTRTSLAVDKLTMTAGPSRIAVNGTLKDFTHPALHATYEAQFSTGDLARILKDASLPEGVIHSTGSLTFENRANSSFLQNVHIAGDLSSPALRIKVQGVRTEVRDLNAGYTLDRGNLEIRNIRAHALGGSATAALTIRDLAGVSHSRLQAQLRDISLEQIETTAPHYSLPEANLTGKISVDAEATWGRTIADLAAHANATLTGSFGRTPSAPLSGTVRLDYAAVRREITLRQSYVSTPGASLTLDGKLSHDSQLNVVARSTNLHQLELLAASLQTAFSGKPPQKLDLYGTASFAGSATGSLAEPQVRGKLEAHDLRVKGSSWKLLRSNVEASPSALVLNNGQLEAEKQGKINFTLRTELKQWNYTPASAVTVNASVGQMPLANIEWLSDYVHKVSGTLSGNVALHGSQLNPVGHGEVSLISGKIISEPFHNITLKFQGDGKAVQANLLAHLPAGTGEAQIKFDPATQQYQVQIRATNIRLERLQAIKRRNQSIVGSLNLTADGHGTISSPEFNAKADISQLRVGDQSIQGVTLEAGIRGQVAEINLKSEVAQTPFSGHGTVQITAPYMADIKIDAARVSFQPLVVLYAPNLGGQIQGQAELHASLHGPLQNPRQLEGHIEIPVLKASYAQLQVSAAKPLRADYKNGELELQQASLQGTGTSLQMQATIPVNDPAAANYLVKGTIDLSLARSLQPDLAGSGQIQIELDSRKRTTGSDKVGEVRLVNAGLHTPDTPLGLDNGNGVLSISRSRLDIESMQGQVGGGTVSLRGGITFRPAVRFDLGMTGSDIRLRYPEGVRSLLESNLTFAGNKESATLSGNVTVQNLSLSRDFDLLDFASHINEIESTSSGGFMQNVRLNINLQSASQMDVASSKVSLSGSANLRIVGTAEEPVILGRASLNGGDLFLGGNRYVLQNGAIDFVNPLRTEPVINVQVKTTIDQYDITLNLQGPMDRMTTTYNSEPPLPAADITNLLAFGHTSETAGGNTGSLGNLGAQGVLTQGLSTVSNRVEKFAGLSYFSIDPTLGGSDQNAGARVVIQERVTSNLVVTYSTDVTSTQRQAIQLEYKFNPRWSVSGVRDQNGGFGTTLNFHKVF